MKKEINKRTRRVHKNKRPPLKKKNFLVRVCFYVFRLLSSLIKSSFTFIFFLFKNKPKIFSAFCISLVCSIIAIICIDKAKNYSEKLLPTSVNVEINNPKIYNLVNDDITKCISHAQKTHSKHSYFLKQISNILFSYDQIDQYWIRLGFDRTLQINATLQIPILILETKEGEKYVVSSTSKIIAKNPNSNEYPGLYLLSAPEIKVNWRSKTSQLKNKTNLPSSVKLTSANKDSINFSWLVNQTRIIYSNFQGLGLNFLVTKVTWNSIAGFQLTLVEQKNTPLPLAQNEIYTLSVLLGKENLVLKIKQLKTVLNDISQKNLRPTEIDLDYTDKASFKVSTSNQVSSSKIL